MSEVLYLIKESTLKAIADSVKGKRSLSKIKVNEISGIIDEIEPADDILNGQVEDVTLKDISYRIGAFYGCKNIKIIHAEDVTLIPESCFEKGLASGCNVYLSPTIKTIGANAFNECNYVRNIYFSGTLDEWAMINFANPQSSPLYATQSAKLYINGRVPSSDIELEATYVNSGAFRYCLFASVKALNALYLSSYAFNNCDSMTQLKLGVCESIGERAVGTCKSLEVADLGTEIGQIDGYAFANDYRLKHLVIRNTTDVVTLKSVTGFDKCYWLLGTKDATYNPQGEIGGIYVPDDLVDSYKSATNWSKYAAAIKPLSSYVNPYATPEEIYEDLEGTDYGTFTFNGKTYKFPKGVTWDEFIESKYSLGDFILYQERGFVAKKGTTSSGGSVLYAPGKTDSYVTHEDLVVEYNYVSKNWASLPWV